MDECEDEDEIKAIVKEYYGLEWKEFCREISHWYASRKVNKAKS